jgi:hypothetical protein
MLLYLIKMNIKHNKYTNKYKMINSLHKDIVHSIILNYCEIKDIINIIPCNKSTTILFEDENLWKKLMLRDNDKKDFIYDGKITWYDLYVILYKNKQFRLRSANLHEIDKSVMDDWFGESRFTKELVSGLVKYLKVTGYISKITVSEHINQYLKQYAKKDSMSKIKRGDILHFSGLDDSLHLTTYIYDGNQIQPLSSSDHDEEKESIPFGYYAIDEFPIYYWHNIKLVNDGISINKKYYPEIVKNIKKCNDNTNPHYKSSFIYNYEIYTVIMEFNEDHRKFIDKINIYETLSSNPFTYNPFHNYYPYMHNDKTIFMICIYPYLIKD